MSDSTRAQLTRYIRAQLHDDKFEPRDADTFDRMGLDSLDVIEMSFDLEQERPGAGKVLEVRLSLKSTFAEACAALDRYAPVSDKEGTHDVRRPVGRRR